MTDETISEDSLRNRVQTSDKCVILENAGSTPPLPIHRVRVVANSKVKCELPDVYQMYFTLSTTNPTRQKTMNPIIISDTVFTGCGVT